MKGFQSTLPARGATPDSPIVPVAGVFQSTLPARGATDCLAMRIRPRGISIHAPREGSDRGQIPRRKPAQFISIHAPREGSDKWTRTHSQTRRNFNPRSPRGERPRARCKFLERAGFQSTLPARGATPSCRCLLSFRTISIHAPREGSDYSRGFGRSCKQISIHAPREGSDVV